MTILDETKQFIGVAPLDTSFDFELLSNLSAAIGVLEQLDIGQEIILDTTTTWDQFFSRESNHIQALAKNYVFTKVRRQFDGSNTNVSAILKEYLDELIWRVNMETENLYDSI